MEKFAINLGNLKYHVMFDCILMNSAVAQSYDYKDFYTNVQKEPDNWYDDFINDIRSSVHCAYENENFYICYTDIDDDALFDKEKICYIFFRDKVYAFDAYYTDCPIFQTILNK